MRLNLAETQGGPARSPLQVLSQSALRLVTSYAVVLVWGVLFLIYGVVEPHAFLTTGTLTSIFGSQEPLVFLTLALVWSFSVGEFDLSVAGTLDLSATVLTVLVVNDGINVVWASIIAVIVAGLAGLLNAFIIVVLRVNGIITTLAMGTVLLGLSLFVANSQPIVGLSTSFGKFANFNIGSLPIDFYYGILVAIVLAYTLGYTPLGRQVEFVGANHQVARLGGVNVNPLRFGAYIVSALICGFGGILLAASVGGNDPTQTANYLLSAFAAVFLGRCIGRTLRYNVVGSLIAIYFLVTGVIGLQLLGYTGWVTSIFYGGALIVGVTVSHALRQRSG